MNEILEEVMRSPGYSNSLSLREEELSVLYNVIEAQWISVINREYPHLIDVFKNAGLAKYHEVSHLVDHNKLWKKVNRCLAEVDVNKIKKLPFFFELKKIFGDFKVSDIAYDSTNKSGVEEIYWRLVRPNVKSDVGPLHADKWFHELGQGGLSSSKSAFTIKVWIPIICDPGKSGLMMVTDSHLKEWKHTSISVDGVLKPVFDDVAEPILIETEPGNMLIFREETLHGGALNKGSNTRVSVEITMVFSHNFEN